MKLSIIIPVYNEGANFAELYKNIKKNIKTSFRLIVVYDFEKDNTIPVVKNFQKKDKRIILHKNTLGKGALNALKSGFNYVKSGPLVVVMADLSDDLSVVDRMYVAYTEGASVVCGSRYMKGGKQIGGPLIKRIMSHMAGVSLYWLKRFPTHDVTNNFKLYDKKFLDGITIESKGGFEVAMEITVKAFKKGSVIKEIPSTWKDRTDGKTKFKLLRWLPSYMKWYFYALI